MMLMWVFSNKLVFLCVRFVCQGYSNVEGYREGRILITYVQ